MSTSYHWKLLRAGPISLDGGGMFGVVPRVVWSRYITADELGRITVAHNCLLLRPAGDPAASPVLIETGSGDKLGPKMRAVFGLTDYTILNAVRDAGAQPEEIEHVIVSHLHFDHAGGLTRTAREGETPDWIRPAKPVSEDAPAVKLAFPNATVIVQRREWDDALVNRSVMTRTYLADHLEPIRDRLRLVDSPAPFAPGHVPDREEAPANEVFARETEVLPGVFVFLVPGHTWGQQAIRFADTNGQNVVFVPDVMPTVHHVGAAYSLAYDVEPYMSSVTRRWLLETAMRHNWLLVLDHEPQTPLVRVRRNEKRAFELVPDATGSA